VKQSTMKVVQTRGGIVESEHAVSAVRCDEHGEVLGRIGDPMVTSWRSAAKPFQLEANLRVLESSFVEELQDADLAVGAASHSGQPAHTDRVQSLLRRFELTQDHLYCGGHWPVHDRSARVLARNADEPASIFNNCSGKHAYMAAAANALAEAEDYRDSDHPVQRSIRTLVDARIAPHVIEKVGIDGCGVPTYGLELAGMATAWARLARSMKNRDGLLSRIGWAMNAFPEMVSGEGRQDLAQIHGATSPIVTKVGAVGLSCIAVVEQGEGVVVKMRSGNNEARALAVQAVLNHWYDGLIGEGVMYAWEKIHNCVGTEVGHREALWGEV
jgi:L-asparaginase II